MLIMIKEIMSVQFTLNFLDKNVMLFFNVRRNADWQPPKVNRCAIATPLLLFFAETHEFEQQQQKRQKIKHKQNISSFYDKTDISTICYFGIVFISLSLSHIF